MFQFNPVGDFYIQLKGNNAGKPIKEKIPNSIGVLVNRDLFLPEYFYYLMLAVYYSGLYKKYIKGSVIPYIRHDDIVIAFIDYSFNREGIAIWKQ